MRFRFSAVILALWGVCAAVGAFFPNSQVLAADGYNALAAPSPEHWLGADSAGRDIFLLLLKGSETALLLAVTVFLGTAALTLLLLWVFAILPRAGQSLLSSLLDSAIALPMILLALLLAAVWGESWAGIIISCSAAYSLQSARIASTEIARGLQSGYVKSSRQAGAGRSWIFWHDLVPSVIPLLWIPFSNAAALAILAEIGLTYLGTGLPASVASWGTLLAGAAPYAAAQPVAFFLTGGIAALAGLSLNLMGDFLSQKWEHRA